MKKTLLTALAACLLPFQISSAESANTYIGLILDCSASMWNRLEDGRYRIDAAKEVLVDFLSNTPNSEGLNIGIRIYGSKVHFSKNGACADSVLVVPVEGFNRSGLIQAVRDARAIGATPLAHSLELAVGDFTKPGTRRLIICTDGEESCGGDVRAALEALKAAGVDVDVRIIGIGLPDAAAKRFEEMGVPVENVHTAGNLATALSKATAEAIVEKPAPQTQKFTIRLIRNGQPLADQTVEFFNSLTREEITLSAEADGIFTGEATPGAYTAAISPAERSFEALAVTPDAAAEFVLDLTVVPKVTITATPRNVVGGGVVTVRFEGAIGLPEEWIGFQSQANHAGRPTFWIGSNGQASGEIEIQAPAAPGEYTLDFYTTFLGSEQIAGSSEIITVEQPEVTLEVPSEVPANTKFEVKWSAPEISGAWIGFWKKDAKDGDYINYNTRLIAGEALQFTAPGELGEYEVRYHSPGTDVVIARAPFKLTESEMSLNPTFAVRGF